MCTMVAVRTGVEELECNTIGELAEALGVRPRDLYPIINADAEAILADECLCNVDVEKLGGRKATHAEGFPSPEFIIEMTEVPA